MTRKLKHKRILVIEALLNAEYSFIDMSENQMPDLF